MKIIRPNLSYGQALEYYDLTNLEERHISLGKSLYKKLKNQTMLSTIFFLLLEKRHGCVGVLQINVGFVIPELNGLMEASSIIPCQYAH